MTCLKEFTNNISSGFNPESIWVLLFKILPKTTDWNSGLLNSFISKTPTFPSLVMIVLFGIVKALGILFSKKAIFNPVSGDNLFCPVINWIETLNTFTLSAGMCFEKILVTLPWNNSPG